MKTNNFNAKFKLILLLNFIIFIALIGKSYATSEYFVGEKSNHTRKEEYLNGITEEMCTADYWRDKNFMDIDKVLMTYDEIKQLNQKTVDASGTMIFDLEKLSKTFDADKIKAKLANTQIPTRDLYINSEKINNNEYFTTLLNAIKETGYSGEEHVKYGICTNRANVKAWPVDDIVGYSATDTDDELQSSAMNLNEPMIIQAKCEINGNIYYWGYSNNCTGWVNSKGVAICETEEEWLNYWKVNTEDKNFVTVTGSRIILKSANEEDVSAMLGSILKLVPENEIPADLVAQSQNNYVVYFAGNDENGKAIKKYGILNKQLELNQGFLSLTQNNILDVAFSCIGDEYGWGGMNGNMDCSLYTRYIYRCFGFELPRNTSWQQKIPEKYIDTSSMGDEEKIKYISTLPAGSLFYISGHTMVYIGMDENKNFVVSDLGTVVDETGDIVVKDVYAVTVNSLDVRRGNGTTWLRNIIGVVSFMKPININDCEIEIENPKLIYDGEEKKPNVYVKYDNKPIYEGINYTIEYSNNVEIGTANIKISGINNFTKEITKTFEIYKEEKNPDEQNKNKTEDENENKTEDENENKDIENNKDENKNNENQNVQDQKTENKNDNTNQNTNDNNKVTNGTQTNNQQNNNNNSYVSQIKKDTTTDKSSIPNTGDKVIIYVIMLVVSTITFIGSFIKIKPKD